MNTFTKNIINYSKEHNIQIGKTDVMLLAESIRVTNEKVFESHPVTKDLCTQTLTALTLCKLAENLPNDFVAGGEYCES